MLATRSVEGCVDPLAVVKARAKSIIDQLPTVHMPLQVGIRVDILDELKNIWNLTHEAFRDMHDRLDGMFFADKAHAENEACDMTTKTRATAIATYDAPG